MARLGSECLRTTRSGWRIHKFQTSPPGIEQSGGFDHHHVLCVCVSAFVSVSPSPLLSLSVCLSLSVSLPPSHFYKPSTLTCQPQPLLSCQGLCTCPAF